MPGAIFPEFGIGYWIGGIDSQVNLAYRQLDLHQSGYNVTQTLSRQSLTLEFGKFLFDYHGFVPFVGASIGGEYHAFAEQEGGVEVARASEQRVVPGILFGWDIRPRLSVPVVLRTNLRYAPLQDLDVGGKKVPFDQFEFNFIQVVVYPGRFFLAR